MRSLLAQLRVVFLRTPLETMNRGLKEAYPQGVACEGLHRVRQDHLPVVHVMCPERLDLVIAVPRERFSMRRHCCGMQPERGQRTRVRTEQ